MNPHYPRVAQRAAHQCEYCRAPEAVFNMAFEVEHIIPTNRGGRNDESNWARACRSCNVYKSDCIEVFDADTRGIARLFHPRLDLWVDHFSFEKSTGLIVGRTPVGRVTVARLQMNRSVQLAARQQWMRLRLFPPS
jgi:hypothetical protein